MDDKQSTGNGRDIDRRTVLQGAAISGIGMVGFAGFTGSAGAKGGPPCFKDFECAEGETYVKIEFVIEEDDDGNVVDCYFEEETDTGLVEITDWETKEGEACEPIYVEWDAGSYVASSVLAYGGKDCDTEEDPDGSYNADQEGEAGLDNKGGNTAAISHLQFCLTEAPEETEAMLVTDLSESMQGSAAALPGTPDVDGEPNDNNPPIEAVKAAVGDGATGPGLLSGLADECPETLEIGSVSAAQNINHLDDTVDDTNDTSGNDGDDLQSHLDKGLHSLADAPAVAKMKSLFSDGTDFAPDFETEDPTQTAFEAVEPYRGDSGTTVGEGVDKAHRALLPDGYESSIPVDVQAGGPPFEPGIDPHGNADEPGDVRKVMVVFTDSGFTDSERIDFDYNNDGNVDQFDTADFVSDAAAADDIDVVPVMTNSNPSGLDVEFAKRLTTDGFGPFFATHYAPGDDPGTCPTAVENDPDVTCTSMVEAIDELQTHLCEF